MKRSIYLTLVSIAVSFFACKNDTAIQRIDKQILFFCDSLRRNPDEIEQLSQVLRTYSPSLTITEHLSYLHEDSLLRFSALVLGYSKLDKLGPVEKQSIARYVEAGGACLFINNSLSTPFSWPLYEAYMDPDSLSAHTVSYTSASGTAFLINSLEKGKLVLAKVSQPDWTLEPLPFLLSRALTTAIGKNRYDSTAIRSPKAPDIHRFSKVVLDSLDMDEPMELTVLPDGKVLFIERKGKLKLYDPQHQASKVLHTFDVCISGNYEDGMLGLTHDPDFASNHYIYLYYSPSSDCSIPSQYLSRFTLSGSDSLILASEKVILEVPVQRETCCHSGGSLAFGPDGYLYLSTGDNTSSKESDGYAPLDERPGRSPFDSQKSSSNTQDLRGKILRIQPHSFGTYTNPSGNLFAGNSAMGRPEIYVMGARNPFRISLDATGNVYWGDVGPDGTEDGKYGPQSYDEFNRAGSAGNYGWPYFVGDNKAYRYRDFERDSVGAFFNPLAPVNNSPNNNGLKKLPPARKALIWYGKAPSREFPQLGQGSNSALSGPHYNTLIKNPVSLPAYYKDKWFIYDWARSWIRVVTLTPKGGVAMIEPFLDGLKWVKPIDMELGPDGALYVLEYGQNYFMKNPEARLSRIEYVNENRKPSAKITASQTAGALPLRVEFSAEGSIDYDLGDTLTYYWYFDDSTKRSASGVKASYEFTRAGKHTVLLKVKDQKGALATRRITILAGNAVPQIDLQIEGNTQFYLSGTNPAYRIHISDKEDEAGLGINPASIGIQWVYAAEGYDTEVLLGKHKESLAFYKGKNLIQKSDCASCHDMNLRSIGPSYQEIAARYKGQSNIEAYLANKILKGGNGNWGEKIMAGHPQHTEAEAREMVKYILSLGTSGSSLPMQGVLQFSQHKPQDIQGEYLLAVDYTDRGVGTLAPQTGRSIHRFRAPYLQAEKADSLYSAWSGKMTGDETTDAAIFQAGGTLLFRQIDLRQIHEIRLRIQVLEKAGLLLSLDKDGTKPLARLSLNPPSKPGQWQELTIQLNGNLSVQDIYLIIDSQAEKDGIICGIDRLHFR